MTEQELQKLKQTVENLFNTCDEIQKGFTRLTSILIAFDQRLTKLEKAAAEKPKLIRPEVNGRFHA